MVLEPVPKLCDSTLCVPQMVHSVRAATMLPSCKNVQARQAHPAVWLLLGELLEARGPRCELCPLSNEVVSCCAAGLAAGSVAARLWRVARRKRSPAKTPPIEEGMTNV